MADKKSQQAAAELYRLAQATALIRLYRESKGHDASSPDVLNKWWRGQGQRLIMPTDGDFKATEREHPELVALARKGVF